MPSGRWSGINRTTSGTHLKNIGTQTERDFFLACIHRKFVVCRLGNCLYRTVILYRYMYMHGHFIIWSCTSQFSVFRGRKTWLNGCIEKSDHSRARVQKSDLDVTAYNAEPYHKRTMCICMYASIYTAVWSLSSVCQWHHFLVSQMKSRRSNWQLYHHTNSIMIMSLARTIQLSAVTLCHI